MHGHRFGRALLLAMTVLAGCDGSMWHSADQRINDAIPPSTLVLQAKARLQEMAAKDAQSTQLFEAEYQTRSRLRALTCAQGKEPSLLESRSSIRERLPLDCFQKADEEIVALLNQRRLRLMLIAAPLRNVPQVPANIISSSTNIAAIRFAASAGIALAASYNSIEIIDLGNDETLYTSEKVNDAASTAEISPNGRVFAVHMQDQGLVLRDATNGDVLARYPDHTRLTWLDSTAALLQRKDGSGVDLLDINADRLQPVKGQIGYASRVIRSPVNPEQFIINASGIVSAYQLTRDGNGLRLLPVGQQSAPQGGWSEGNSTTTADGRLFVQFTNSSLWVTDLESMKSQEIPMPELRVVGIMPLPGANEVLLRLGLAGGAGGYTQAVYSLDQQVFAPVTEEGLADAQGYSGARTVRIAPLNRVGLLSGKTVRLLDEVGRGFRYGPQAFTQYLQEQMGVRQQKVAAAEALRRGYVSTSSVNGVPVMAGPVADLARGARIEGIGVYEPEGSSTGAGAAAVHRRMPINVIVRRSDKPIVLVLSSYEIVDWRVTLTGGAQVKAVLLSGYKDSTVTGTGNVRVVNLGRFYAYEQGSGEYANLQREVTRWTGQAMSVFQGRYKAASFMVGGQ